MTNHVTTNVPEQSKNKSKQQRDEKLSSIRNKSLLALAAQEDAAAKAKGFLSAEQTQQMLRKFQAWLSQDPTRQQMDQQSAWQIFNSPQS